MRPGSAFACAAITLLLASPSVAQEVDERYRLERTEDGYVRLDTQTGRMSLCQERDGQLVCRMATEERAAYDRDIDALQDRVEALEARVAALESGRPAAALPSEEEFEQTLGYMERFFRRFMGIVTEFDRRFGDGESRPPADRT